MYTRLNNFKPKEKCFCGKKETRNERNLSIRSPIFREPIFPDINFYEHRYWPLVGQLGVTIFSGHNQYPAAY